MLISLMKEFEKLQHSTDELLAKLAAVPEDRLHQPESDGKWSVIQVLNHLKAAEKGSLLYCMKKIQAGDEMEDTTGLAMLKMHAFSWLMRFPFKLTAPSFLSSPSNTESLEELQRSWTRSREKLKDFIDNYPEKYRSKSIYKHPYAGRVDLKGMLHFFAAHQRHHEIQIRRILNKVKHV